ncbi:MAG: hypothetical protein ACKOCF_01575, partial [Gammaproteobacteria bacterium]
MSAARNPIVIVSLLVALLSSGWAIYATRRAGSPGGGGMGPPSSAQGPSGAQGPGGVQGSGGVQGQGAASRGASGPGRPGATGMRGGPPAAGMPISVVSREVSLQPIARELRALGTARANEAVEITAKTSNI